MGVGELTMMGNGQMRNASYHGFGLDGAMFRPTNNQEMDRYIP